MVDAIYTSNEFFGIFQFAVFLNSSHPNFLHKVFTRYKVMTHFNKVSLMDVKDSSKPLKCFESNSDAYFVSLLHHVAIDMLGGPITGYISI